MQVCDAICICNPQCESGNVKALDGTKRSDACSAMRIRRITFAMRCIFAAMYALAVEIHCDVGHDARIIASAMPQYG